MTEDPIGKGSTTWTDEQGRECIGVWADQGGRMLTLRREKNGAVSVSTDVGDDYVTIAKFRAGRVAHFLAPEVTEEPSR